MHVVKQMFIAGALIHVSIIIDITVLLSTMPPRLNDTSVFPLQTTVIAGSCVVAVLLVLIIVVTMLVGFIIHKRGSQLIISVLVN